MNCFVTFSPTFLRNVDQTANYTIDISNLFGYSYIYNSDAVLSNYS